MSDLTPEDIRAAAAPKSDQLNADDLIAGPMTFTVSGVKRGNKEQPVIVELEEFARRPYKPCKGMLRVLIGAWSEDPYNWVGKRLRVFRNPDVMYSGVKLGGIEISHMSHLATDLQFMRTIRRGVKAPFTVARLADEPKPTRPTAEQVAEVKESWKAKCASAGEVVSPQLWKAFVFGVTERAFDVSKAGEWTTDELTSVSDAITQPIESQTQE